MNYLVHFYLSDPEPLCRLGNLMGDFVKGRLERHNLDPGLVRGLRQHRAVDRLSQVHEATRMSRARLDRRFRHLKGILVDIFYDHLLAKNWEDWAQGSLAGLADQAYRLLRNYRELLPERFRPMAQRMIAYDWLNAYRKPETIELVLARLAGRLKRPNLLAQGYLELSRCSRAMEPDCRRFLKAARAMLDKEANHVNGNAQHD
jgi:acyl carrier protein phosphodiesterase